MTGGARRFGWVAVLGLAFGLAGCAAGAPGSVVPAPIEGEQVAAPVLTPAAPDNAGPVAAAVGAAGGVPVSDAGAASEPAPAAAGGAASEPVSPDAAVVDVSAPDANGSAETAAAPVQSAPAQPAAEPAPATTEAAAAVEAESAVASAFSSAADPGVMAGAVAAPASANTATAQAPADPAPAPVDAAAAAAPAVVAPDAGSVAEGAAAAPSAQTGRPPAPATDGSGLSQIIEGGSNGRKEVALTFDAGADAGYAEAILDILRDEGVRATFGMTGAWAEKNPVLIQRMVAEGHQLINHTWSHGSLTGANTGQPAMTYEQLADELASTEQIIRDLTGYELQPYFRPPYGDYDLTMLGYLYALGYPFSIWWTCDTRGWDGWSATKIFETCTSVPLEDEIYLMHVGAAAVGDFEVLPTLISYYREQGYAFVSVEEMLQP
jgi:peptidoglycan/xylan/chitin deacetylase (PgdA/CDA1 family)